MASLTFSFFSRPWLVFVVSIFLRIVLLVYGRWQDAHSPVKYTDIDYLVFTDAARFVARGRSPYERATYRYTPLLAWLLYPTTWGGWWFEFGKVVFALGDVVTGYLIYLILRQHGSDGHASGLGTERSMKLASIWLLNPMVANISTRGSSEGLLAVMVVALLWAALQRRLAAAGCLLGLGVHFKIYPFIYAASIFWWLSPENWGQVLRGRGSLGRSASDWVYGLFRKERILLVFYSALVFLMLSGWMIMNYSMDFVKHTYLYHFTRIDHRHNFSVYNTVLHLNSAYPDQASSFKIESLAFVPQLCLSVLAIPFYLSEKDLAGTMLAQTFAFVTFNKVCTSQYFLWYMVFLPFYLPNSSFWRKPRLGIAALVLWVLGQAAWLQQGFELEFMGKSTFVPGLWLAGIAFFLINCWILGVIVADIGSSGATTVSPSAGGKLKKDR